VVPQALGHLHYSVGAGQDPHDDPHLWLLSEGLLQLATSDDDVEELVGATHLHVSFQGHGVIALHERIEGLVQVDRIAPIPALAEHVPGQELLHGEDRAHLDEVAKGCSGSLSSLGRGF